MDLEPLEKYRLQALCEKCHSEFQILIKGLLYKEVTLGQIAMEDEVKAFRIN